MILIIKLIEIVLVVCVWDSFVFASFFLRPHKKKFRLSSSPASDFPAASIFFYLLDST